VLGFDLWHGEVEKNSKVSEQVGHVAMRLADMSWGIISTPLAASFIVVFGYFETRSPAWIHDPLQLLVM